MEVFKPIKVENYQFVKNGLNQYQFTQDLEDSITDLEKRIEKLEEGFREIELKNRDKNGEIYDLVGRIREINRTGQRYRLSLYED